MDFNAQQLRYPSRVAQKRETRFEKQAKKAGLTGHFTRIAGRSAFHTNGRVRQCVETCLGNRTLTFFASAVGAVFNPLKRVFDGAEGVFFSGEQAEGEFLFEVVAAKLGHVDGHRGIFRAIMM
jgi:hypothetical protein